MFEMLWGKLKGVREGQQIAYPMDKSPDKQEVRDITSTIKLNDYVICPNRKEAQRVYRLLQQFNMQGITRSVMFEGKEAVKVWRIR